MPYPLALRALAAQELPLLLQALLPLTLAAAVVACTLEEHPVLVGRVVAVPVKQVAAQALPEQ